MKEWLKYIVLYLNELWFITIEMSPYIMLGFLFSGILHVFIRQSVFQKYFGKSGFKSVLNASLFGVPLPLCSCGVIPTAISFYRHGASKGATVSFLISTPQTGIDSIFATYSLIGLPFALTRVIVAFVSGIIGGMITNFFDKSKVQSSNTITEEKNTSQNFLLIRIFRYAFIEFLQDIAKWLLIGLLLAALIAVIVPDNFFEQSIGNQYIEILMILLVSIPLYICATGSVPVAAILLMKGLSPGAALVLLMAGPATNAATMTVIGKSLGKKTLLLYLITIIGSSIIFGLIINSFIPDTVFLHKINSHIHQHGNSPIHLISGIVFSLLLLNALAIRYKIFRFLKNRTKTEKNIVTMDKISVIVKGMTCNHCKNNVETNLKKIGGIVSAEADLANNRVDITGNQIKLENIEKVISELGYEYGGII